MLPFCVNRFFGAVTDTYGTLIAVNEGLKVVFQEGVQDDINPFDADVKCVIVPWAHVQNLQSDRGLISTTVAVKLAETALVEELPFAEEGLMKLTIRSKDVELIEPFLQAVQARQAGQTDSDTDEFIDDMRDFLWDL